MTDDTVKRLVRSGGCRLCLAPDTECVPIFATAAADKEPLSNKILSCVNIKILQADRMSTRICHACISFLNSWQSFKNRCHNAQKKQQQFLDVFMAKERAKQKTDLAHQRQSFDRQQQQQKPQEKSSNDFRQKILKSALLNSTSNSNGSNLSAIDVSFIKEEPEEYASDLDDMDNVDPTQFLAQDIDDDPNAEHEHPQILASLGLTHISQQHSENSTNESQNDSYMAQQFQNRSQANCTICNMQFSNRANARRHERNIHNVRILVQGGSTIIQHKDRPEIAISTPLRLKRPLDVPTEYDYTKPELYRGQLTDPRLNFIRRHMEFLEQYQTMTCKCCNKQFPTYKFFMAHMRKKYDTLSRNLCFKCLKQFQTKPQFIAHLKKRNCLNLYRVFMADETISKEPLPSAPLRHGSKEILANKMYGCRLCSDTFRLKNDFRTHVIEAHSDAQKREIPGATSCGYCSLEFEDSSERRRHFNNVECMVFIICGTCDEHFDTHAAYVEHVYAIHISANNVAKSEYLFDDDNGLMEEAIPPAQSKARSPQNCTVCGKQYNNYYNVLRHMESKHPDQVPTTYRCDRCEIGYPRQVELRDHMFRVHNERIKFDAIKMKREQFSCRECNGSFDDKDAWINHQAEEHSKFGCNLCEEEIEDKEKFLSHLTLHSDSKSYKCPVCQHSFSSERGFETHLSVVHNMTKDEVQDQSNDFSDEMPVECAVEINGDDDAASDSEDDMMIDDVDGDVDETLEQPTVKRIKIDESLQNSPITMNSSPENVSLNTTCRICKESFASRLLLITHMRAAHSSVNRPIPSLTVAGRNIVPSQTHNVNNRLRCRICQKRIHTKNGYKRHMLQVHDVKDCVFIKCTLCPSEFSNDKGLKVHMYRTHNITVQQMQADESLVPIPKQESTSPTPSLVVSRTEASQMFECNICHTVYRSRDQLKSHKAIVHGISEGDLEDADMVDSMTTDNSTFVGETWWQCRFCNESFNASKKLTIHMNSHAEYDNKETKCKDCGNVYGTRKSLWVHRQKKHPRLPAPSPCEICAKTFFDKTELFHHLSTHSNDAVFSHLQAVQEQLEQEQEQENRIKSEQGVEIQENLSCHVCNQKFHDKRVLSKHLRVHEQQKQSENSFSNSALAAMLADTDIATDENAGDYSYPTYKGQKVENGEFACDMCPKRFPHVNALKVHRGWHFRSPDGRQITDSNSIWRPDVGNHSRNKRSRAANPPVCPYCKSTFASGNNLRRHIVEVHKRNEAKMARENGGGDETFIEKELECMACGLTFSNRPEWIDHKINHARTMKPSTTYEWGCEICGKVFTRKERLLVHMTSHMSGKEEDINQKRAEMGFESNSQSSMSSHSYSQQMRSQHSLDSATLRNALQKTTSESKTASVSLLKQQQSLLKSAVQSSNSNEITVLKTNDSNESIDDDMDDENSNEPTGEQTHPCDLCQAIFATNKELRQHIKSHFEGEGLGQNVAETESNADDSQYDEEEDYENEGMDENIIEEDYDEELGEEEDDYNDEEIAEQNLNEVHRTQITGYNCRICGSSSQSHIDMLSCMESHKKPTQIECEECSFYFVNLEQLEKHESLCHPKEEYDDSD